jgi:hypothetical protein
MSMNKGTTGAPVAVGERVDGLELRVRDRGLGQQPQIGAPGEAHQVVHQRRYVCVVRRNELRPMWTG